MDEWLLQLLGLGRADPEPEDELAALMAQQPEEARSVLQGLFDLAEERATRLTGSENAAQRLGIPNLNDPRLQARPDAMAQYQVPQQEIEQLPTPVLDVAGGEVVSDQMRRLGNLADRSNDRIGNLTTAEAIRSSPAYQATRLGTELALDFNPVGIAKDVGMGLASAVQGDWGEATGYGFATVPFIGRLPQEAMRAMKPFDRAGVRQQITAAMMDPNDMSEHLMFIRPGDFLGSAWDVGFPSEKAIRRLMDQTWDEDLIDIPLLGFSPSAADVRLGALKQSGLMHGADVETVSQRLADSLDEAMRARGLPPSSDPGSMFHLNRWDLYDEMVAGAGLPPEIETLLDRHNPFFPGQITSHEGRHRNIYAGTMGREIMPVRYLVDPGTPRTLLDNPTVFRQTNWYDPSERFKPQLIHAPTDLERLAEQSEIAGEVFREYGRSDADAVQRLTELGGAMPRVRDMSDAGDMEVRKVIQRHLRQPQGPTPLGERYTDEFLDLLSGSLYGEPYDFQAVGRRAMGEETFPDLGLVSPGWVKVGADPSQQMRANLFRDFNLKLGRTSNELGRMFDIDIW